MSVKRFSSGGPGKKQCPVCKGDFFPNRLKVCPDCGSPFKKDGDLPEQKQLPLDDTSRSIIPVEHSRIRRKPEVVKTFTVKELLAPLPKGLTIQDVADYVRAQLVEMGKHYKQIALHTYYLGLALNTAMESFEHGEWSKYLIKVGLSETSAWRARELARLVKSPDDLKGMSKTEAYRAFGILKPKLLTEEKSEGEEPKVEQPNVEKPKEEESKESGSPTKVEDPALDKTPLEEDEAGEDLSNEKPDSSEFEAVIPDVKEHSPETPSQDGEGQPAKSSGEKQPELRVAFEDLTEAEMDALTIFVKAAGTLERAKAVFKTWCKANADLYAD